MAAGKPVVASRIGGIPETVLDGVHGILVRPGQPEELAQAVIRLARDPALRARMGLAAREHVAREFNPVKIAQQTLGVYEQAIESSLRRRTRRHSSIANNHVHDAV